MTHGKWHTIRSFPEHAQEKSALTVLSNTRKTVTVSSAAPKGRPSCLASWRRAAAFFALLSLALFSSTARGQLPTTTALPYLLTNDGLPNAPIVTASFPVVRVPDSVAQSNIGSLLGGGFSAALTIGIGSTTEAAAAAVAIAGARKIQSLRTLNQTNKIKQQMQEDAQQGEANEEATLPEGCGATPNAVPLTARAGSRLTASAGLVLTAKARRLQAKARRRLIAQDAGSCSLPEEDEADAAEEALEELTEVGNASQEAIEGAEEAAEAAEVAAEVAEDVAEAAEVAIEVFEAIIEALALAAA